MYYCKQGYILCIPTTEIETSESIAIGEKKTIELDGVYNRSAHLPSTKSVTALVGQEFDNTDCLTHITIVTIGAGAAKEVRMRLVKEFKK